MQALEPYVPLEKQNRILSSPTQSEHSQSVKDQFCLSAQQPWATYLTSPSLSLFTHKMKTVIVPTSLVCENKIGLAQSKCSVNANYYASDPGL